MYVLRFNLNDCKKTMRNNVFEKTGIIQLQGVFLRAM